MEFVIILVVFVVIIAIWMYQSEKKKSSDKNKLAIAKLSEQANHYLSKIDSAKTVTSKINNCDKGLDLLIRAGQYPECRTVITNYDELIDRIQRIKKVLPVGDYLEKAQKHNFKGKDSSEKNSLLDALYEIRTNNITNEDFEIANLHDDQTGEIITVEKVENRLKDLGWEG